MFPEKIVFDGSQHRTSRLNSAVLLMYAKKKGFQENNKGTNLSFLDLSQKVAPPRIELGSKV